MVDYSFFPAKNQKLKVKQSVVYRLKVKNWLLVEEFSVNKPEITSYQ